MLERIYVGIGDERHVSEGSWERAVGIPLDAEANVVLLADAPDEYSRFLAIGDGLLLLLDADLEPRVGTPAHAFTLSRTE